MGQRCAFENFPVCLGGEGIEILISAAVQSCVRSPNDPAKIAECFFIDLVILEQLRVVAKIPKKGVEFPESSFGAVQPSGEESAFERFGFQYDKSELYEWLLWMPLVASPIHAYKE